MELNKYDLNWCVRRLPTPVRKMLKESTVTVGGGYVRSCILNEKICDIDLFVKSRDYAETLADRLIMDTKRRKVVTDNAITVTGMKYPVQFITRWTYDTPVKVVNSFDFTICQSAFWWNIDSLRWNSHVTDTFYPDLAAKRLIYTEPDREEEPGGIADPLQSVGTSRDPPGNGICA